MTILSNRWPNDNGYGAGVSNNSGASNNDNNRTDSGAGEWPYSFLLINL